MTDPAQPSSTRMLRLPEVLHLTGLKRDAVYKLGAKGEFPRPRKLSERSSAWRSDEVAAWIESRSTVTLPVEAAPVPRPAPPPMAPTPISRARRKSR